MQEQRSITKELISRFPQLLTLLLASGIGITTVVEYLSLTVHATNENPWNANAETLSNGTVPDPTPEISPTNEAEPLELGNFNAVVRAYDDQGNITPGVVVAFVHSTRGDVLAEDYDFNQGSYGIAPISENINGTASPQQFSPEGTQAIFAGQQPADFWQSLIDKALAEGDNETAKYLQTHFPPVQDMQNIEILINNYRSSEGENPTKITAQFKTDENGKQTAIWAYEYPSYRAQAPDSLQEIGVSYGLLAPIENPTASISITEGISATFSSVDEPELRVTTGDESILVSSPSIEEPSQVASNAQVINAETNFELGKLQITAENQLMLERQRYFDELFLATNGNPDELVSIQSLNKLPIELPEGDRKLSTVISGTAEITPKSTFIVSFDNATNETLRVQITNFLPTDCIELKVVNGKIVASNLSSTDHMPTITYLDDPIYNHHLFISQAKK